MATAMDRSLNVCPVVLTIRNPTQIIDAVDIWAAAIEILIFH